MYPFSNQHYTVSNEPCQVKYTFSQEHRKNSNSSYQEPFTDTFKKPKEKEYIMDVKLENVNCILGNY